MSAFMCSPRTISIVADVMTKRAWKGISVQENFSDFVGMNIDALVARYKEVDVDMNAYKFISVDYSLLEAIKCMDCYLYQCSEGDIPKRYIYTEAVKVRNMLILDYMHEKIMNSPEYEALPWE